MNLYYIESNEISTHTHTARSRVFLCAPETLWLPMNKLLFWVFDQTEQEQ